MKKKKFLIIGILIVVVLVVFLVSRLSNKHGEGMIVLSGNVEVTEANIGFKLSGRVVELLVDEGYKVKKGDILARLDNAELASIVTQNRASLQEALTRLAELRAGSRTQEIEQARANVSSAEAELIKAKKDYERYETLYRNDAISAQQMDASKKTYDVTVSQHKKALETLSLVKEGPRKEEITAAEHRVQQARAALATSEERLKDTTIYSPFSGVILRKNIELGETVAPGIPVYTIGDLENPWIKVYVKEDRLGHVKLGQKVKVNTDSYPGKTYEGTVTFISSEAEFTPKIVQTQEERVKLVFGVKVSVKNINDELKPGMPADVRILLR
ncbi:MAG: efflux RND transporter periplasmic adaptor subunit [Nitrospirota bacterium]|nr:efflux RND transporter periplasmic adaptor subunit [Nitrospirota bacterium]MDH5767539.1 efflux RND transporter periplasmic adaptor subunit [Nitrospirota bacterium]